MLYSNNVSYLKIKKNIEILFVRQRVKQYILKIYLEIFKLILHKEIFNKENFSLISGFEFEITKMTLK